jgi:hypothetical protein
VQAEGAWDGGGRLEHFLELSKELGLANLPVVVGVVLLEERFEFVVGEE